MYNVTIRCEKIDNADGRAGYRKINFGDYLCYVLEKDIVSVEEIEPEWKPGDMVMQNDTGYLFVVVNRNKGANPENKFRQIEPLPAGRVYCTREMLSGKLRMWD